MLANVTSNGARDVDFLHGSWTFHLRKLRDTTDPDCTEWVESEGTSEAFEGFTLRPLRPRDRHLADLVVLDPGAGRPRRAGPRRWRHVEDELDHDPAPPDLFRSRWRPTAAFLSG
jgi:hypothetical protein